MDGQKDPTARLEAVYRKNRKAFLAHAGKAARNGSDGEDIVQDVLIRLLANVTVLDAITDLTSWIYAAIRNRVIDLWRHDSLRDKAGERAVSNETISQIVAAVGFDPSDILVRKELSDALSEAIGDLPEEQRSVIEAQVFDGISFQELSERTGLPINTLMTRKRLAVKKLSAALKSWIEDD